MCGNSSNAGYLADTDWQAFTNNAVSVLIKGSRFSCDACGVNLNIGTVAIKLLTNRKPKYLCGDCYDKFKSRQRAEKRHIDYVERKNQHRDKYEL